MNLTSIKILPTTKVLSIFCTYHSINQQKELNNDQIWKYVKASRYRQK